MRLLKQYMAICWKTQLEYELSFVLSFVGQLLNTVIYFVCINAMFDRFGSLLDYSRYEVLLAFAAISIGYSINEIFMRGFDLFSRQIISGSFDRLLVRPPSLILQVIGSDFYFARIGKVLQSIGVLAYCLYHLPLAWTPAKVLVLVGMVCSSAFTFAGFFFISASFCFVTIQGLEIMNILNDGGREAAQYPMGIYPKPFLIFFTVAMPLACANTYPLLYLVDRAPTPLYALAPLWGCFFCVPCAFVWLRMVRRYLSTGS